MNSVMNNIDFTDVRLYFDEIEINVGHLFHIHEKLLKSTLERSQVTSLYISRAITNELRSYYWPIL